MATAHRLLSILPVLALVALTLMVPATVSGCSSNDPFVKLHCTFNDNPRVSTKRVVTLFAFNHLYAVRTESNRNNYISGLEDELPSIYSVANRIFREDGINLQIVSLAARDEGDVHGMTTFFGADVPAMLQANQGHAGLIGVFWPEWDEAPGNVSAGYTAHAPCSTAPDEGCNWLSIYGMLINNVPIETIGRSLASAFSFYFNVTPVSDPANLTHTAMFQIGPTGTLLTTQQRDTMWAAVNTGRTELVSETCDPPIQVAPRRPEITSGSYGR
jgi:hypothetical protein